MSDLAELATHARDVYLWDNQAVMVFDEAGQQIAELQSPELDGLAAVVKHSPSTCRFFIGAWRSWRDQIDRYHMECRLLMRGIDIRGVKQTGQEEEPKL